MRRVPLWFAVTIEIILLCYGLSGSLNSKGWIIIALNGFFIVPSVIKLFENKKINKMITVEIEKEAKTKIALMNLALDNNEEKYIAMKYLYENYYDDSNNYIALKINDNYGNSFSGEKIREMLKYQLALFQKKCTDEVIKININSMISNLEKRGK